MRLFKNQLLLLRPLSPFGICIMAWHWQWSITWRWALDLFWGSKNRKKKWVLEWPIKAAHYKTIHIGTPLFLITLAIQQNIQRNAAATED